MAADDKRDSIAITLSATAARLNGKRCGAGFVARCPAHDDRKPSLSITERDGKVLVKCHAGCSQRKVIRALASLGLSVTRFPLRDHAAELGTIVRTYDYTDEKGYLLYQVCRFEPKGFRPRRPDRSGGWIWGYGNVRRVLYHLPEVFEAPIVLIVEGEKDVESLRERGFVATTNPGGADAWRDEFNSVFSGRDVIIVPDNDRPGWRRAIRIARGIRPVATRVRLLELDGAKDISDWFALGHSEVELLHQLQEAL